MDPRQRKLAHIIWSSCNHGAEGIDATEDVDWRAGPVKGATMGFKYFLIK